MYRERTELVGRTVSEAVSLLEFARRNDCKVVIASTSSLYSGNDPPHREDMPVHVTDWYTEARYFVERLAELYLNLHGVRTCCLRLFSVYGPREEGKGRYANLVSQFIWVMRKGESPVIYGDGKQTRDFMYVEDVVDAFLRAMDSDAAGVFNVGTGRETSFNEVVGMLNEELGTSIKPEYVDNPLKNYVYRTCADTKKVEGLLVFRAKVTLREGIRRTAGYYGGRAKEGGGGWTVDGGRWTADVHMRGVPLVGIRAGRGHLRLPPHRRDSNPRPPPPPPTVIPLGGNLLPSGETPPERPLVLSLGFETHLLAEKLHRPLGNLVDKLGRVDGQLVSSLFSKLIVLDRQPVSNLLGLSS